MYMIIYIMNISGLGSSSQPSRVTPKSALFVMVAAPTAVCIWETVPKNGGCMELSPLHQNTVSERACNLRWTICLKHFETEMQ